MRKLVKLFSSFIFDEFIPWQSGCSQILTDYPIFEDYLKGGNSMIKKVLLGMSGGIDSSIAAILLQEQGYQVMGATLRLWSEEDDLNTEIKPNYITEAETLAEKLGIIHLTYDARDQFYKNVIAYFKQEYLEGKTPNPCAKCNVVLKWYLLNQLAQKNDCAYIATGHYVNKVLQNSNYYISKGIDPEKEQSFFLWGLHQDYLKKTIFPLGQLTKQQVKELAIKNGYSSLTNKKESTGACFVKNSSYHPLLVKLLKKDRIKIESGRFIDSNGVYLGKHNGYPFYTVGQRRGLGLSPNEPWYVTEIDSNNNLVVLGKHADLFKHEMLVRNYHIIDKKDFNSEVITRIRYRKQAALSRIEIIDNNLLKVHFINREWSIAPGQTAAFYREDILLGGGFIVG